MLYTLLPRAALRAAGRTSRFVGLLLLQDVVHSVRMTPAAHSPPKPGSGHTSHPFGLGSTDHPQTFGDGYTCVRSYTGHFLAGKTE